MGVGTWRQWLGVGVFALLLAAISSAPWAQSDELSVLNDQLIKLYQAGKYSEDCCPAGVGTGRKAPRPRPSRCRHGA